MKLLRPTRSVELDAPLDRHFARSTPYLDCEARMRHKDGRWRPCRRRSRGSGAGVGLANFQRIVARYGGQIWAESARNEGASFFFTLGVPGP